MGALKIRGICVAFLVVALAACACTRERPGAPALGDVKVQVSNVGFDRGSGAHYVLLEDESQGRELPILIGQSEAQAIALELHGLKPPRPLTQDLLRNILHETGNHVDRVVIYDVRKGVYYARISLDQGRHTVDARPSDAIALAMGTQAPIFVASKLLQPRSATALGRIARLPRSARGLGLTVQELTPRIAKYFNAAPGSGLLVSAVGGEARDAGLKRGDILTEIDGKSIKALPDFDRKLARMRAGDSITLTVRRNGSRHSVTLKALSLED